MAGTLNRSQMDEIGFWAVEVWGGASDHPGWGVADFVMAIDHALDWDRNTLKGHVPISGFAATATEVVNELARV